MVGRGWAWCGWVDGGPTYRATGGAAQKLSIRPDMLHVSRPGRIREGGERKSVPGGGPEIRSVARRQLRFQQAAESEAQGVESARMEIV